MLTKPTQCSDVAMARPTDIRTVLVSYQGHDVAAEFIERSKEHQRYTNMVVLFKFSLPDICECSSH